MFPKCDCHKYATAEDAEEIAECGHRYDCPNAEVQEVECILLFSLDDDDGEEG